MSLPDLSTLNRHELAAAFVTEYLGQYLAPNGCVYRSSAAYAADPLAGSYSLPDFADDANLILRYLEHRRFSLVRVRLPYGYVVKVELAEGTYVKAEHPVLARAACMALIAARRASSLPLPPA